VPEAGIERSSACLVTGAAGFVGSHLAERLLGSGARVTGVDCFSDYYRRVLKERNLARLQGRPAFEFRELDLAAEGAPLGQLLEGVDYVFHQAGQPGVRASWGSAFDGYLQMNVLATQRLLEAARGASLRRFVYASSSSVYGEVAELPVSERALPRPISPYGVTKLAAEHLCGLYARLGVPTVSLRYFSVYGPGQRPDMAFHRFVNALIEGREIEINGDGEQSRDFTYVEDVVEANLAAASPPGQLEAGAVYNIGGGSRVTVNRTIEVLARLVGTTARVRHCPPLPGDVRDTHADCSAARRELGFVPRVGLEEGLRAQVEWQRELART
jgi:nucleoside-diphosphate-sugar epimerase